MNIFFKRKTKVKTLIEEPLSLTLPSGQRVVARLMLSSARKTAVIQIKEGDVVLRAPLKSSRTWLMGFLEEKLGWIEKTLAQDRHTSDGPKRTFEEGDVFYLLGQPHSLRYEEGRPMAALFKDDVLSVRIRKGLTLNERKARATKLVEAHYRMVAVEHFRRRSAYYATLLGREAREVRVRDYKSRWGCCAADGTITYCWRAIMAPDHVVDYLVAHEMAHLVHMNHSRHFWEQVEDMFPHYKTARQWLKANGHLLTLER